MNEDAARAKLAACAGYGANAAEQLETFVAMLQEENALQNLVSQPSLLRVWQRHILDSAQLAMMVPRGTTSLLDLGSGAGLPGVVLATLLPSVKITLVEARSLRADWLDRVQQRLGLRNVWVFGGKLESLPGMQVDVISARAFAPLNRLLTLSSRFSTAETRWLLPKGQSAAEELDRLTGWRHTFRVEPSLTDPSAGIIIGSLQGAKGSTE